MIGVNAGVSSGTRTRRLSGSPISAIELSRVVIGHNDLPSSDTHDGVMFDKLEAHPATAVLLTTNHIIQSAFLNVPPHPKCSVSQLDNEHKHY
jgi:hypothetical protein